MLKIASELIVTDFKEEHPKKALSPMLVMLLGIMIEDNDEHLTKVFLSMFVTLVGIVIEVRE